MGHSCRAHSSYETSSKSHAARLQDERFVRDFLQKSRVKSQKRAFRTRLLPKVTHQVSKTSVSYGTSSKSHMSSPQNERFVSRLPQKLHMSNVCKTNDFDTRLPPKVQRKHASEHAHHAALPSSFAIPAPPNNTRSHANPNVTATFTSTTTHNLTIPCACHESFRKSTRLTRTKYCACHEMSPTSHLATSRVPCACHENRTSTHQKPHKVSAPATKSDNIISCELQKNLHHTTRLE